MKLTLTQETHLMRVYLSMNSRISTTTLNILVKKGLLTRNNELTAEGEAYVGSNMGPLVQIGTMHARSDPAFLAYMKAVKNGWHRLKDVGKPPVEEPACFQHGVDDELECTITLTPLGHLVLAEVARLEALPPPEPLDAPWA